MKKLLILFVLSIGIHETWGQADPTHDASGNLKTAVNKTIEDFGAVADDGIDDSRAFALAARFFSNRDLVDVDAGNDDDWHPGNPLPPNALNVDYTTQYGVLQLSNGVYNVGKQTINNSPSSTEYASPDYFPLFRSIDGLIIRGKGVNKTIIQHTPGLFGWFDPVTGLPKSSPNGGIGTKMGAIIRTAGDTKNIIIEQLSMDGSSDNYTIGSRQSTNPGDFNVIDYGLLVGGQFVTIRNIEVKNFGCDGIQFAASSAIPPPGRYNYYFDNVSSKWNGRQALSWVGGRSVMVVNSTFAYTCLKNGTTDALNPIVSDVAGSIGTNVDLESEVSPIRDGFFENCSIIGNYGTAASLTIHTDVDNVYFRNCSIKGFTNTNPNLGSAFNAIGIGGKSQS